ncbi:MAG: hypothetical protein JOY60_04770 [Burkholderiaceae bacterium]|nr:hypothetical protein [Roseateles sp.]MBV8469156.1 hypothetical protein [Burkholderiaceae bacterium]
MAGSLDDGSDGRSPVLGRFQFRLDGQVLICTVQGPFNAEFIDHLQGQSAGLLDELIRLGKWAVIVVFQSSALTSLSALTLLTRNVRSRAQSGRSPAACALVMSPDVEGAALMTALYLRCYVENGVPAQAFETLESARAWIDARLTE